MVWSWRRCWRRRYGDGGRAVEAASLGAGRKERGGGRGRRAVVGHRCVLRSRCRSRLSPRQVPGMRSAVKEPPAPRGRYAACEWYYHIPLKQPEKLVNSEIPLPPTSQIPGLSDLAEPYNEKMFGGRRKWIKDTDSEYVKLAKQGGQPDLLKHYTPVTRKSSPVAYAAPDWYSHRSNPPTTNEPQSYVSTIPNYMIHEEFKADDHRSNNYEARRAPFDFDMKSVWQRDAEDKENAEKKKVKLPAINPKYPSKMQNVSTNKEFSGKNKLTFPPMPAQRNGEAVNFSKLISNGYGADWIQQRTEWEKNVQQASENSEESKDSEPSQPDTVPASNK